MDNLEGKAIDSKSYISLDLSDNFEIPRVLYSNEGDEITIQPADEDERDTLFEKYKYSIVNAITIKKTINTNL